MLPPKCITCGKMLADIEIEWTLYKKECYNKKHGPKHQIDDLLAAKLDQLHIKSRCCRALVLTYVELVEIIM